MGLIRLLVVVALVYLGWRVLRRFLETPTQPPASPRPKSPHEVLGVPVGASQQEIRTAYLRLVEQYHPDRTERLAPELRQLAEQRTKEINAAYTALTR